MDNASVDANTQVGDNIESRRYCRRLSARRLMSSMAARILSFSSCLEATRMCRRTERASLEKKPSMRLSQEPCLGVKVNAKRPSGCLASQALVSFEMWAA